MARRSHRWWHVSVETWLISPPTHPSCPCESQPLLRCARAAGHAPACAHCGVMCRACMGVMRCRVAVRAERASSAVGAARRKRDAPCSCPRTPSQPPVLWSTGLERSPSRVPSRAATERELHKHSRQVTGIPATRRWCLSDVNASVIVREREREIGCGRLDKCLVWS